MRRIARSLVVSAMAAAVLPVTAAAAGAACDAPYPHARVSLHVGDDDYEVARGSTVHVGGYLQHNDCVLANRRIHLLARTTAGGGYAVVRSVITDARGRYATTLRVDSSVDLTVGWAAQGRYVAWSRYVHVRAVREAQPAYSSFVGCLMPAPPHPAFVPSAGVSLRLVLAQTRVWRGSTLRGELVVRNDRDEPYRFRESGIADIDTALVSTRSGEVMGHVPTSDMGSVRGHEVPPRSELRLPVAFQTRSCQGYGPGLPARPTHVRAVAWLQAAPEDSRDGVRPWVSPAVGAEIV